MTRDRSQLWNHLLQPEQSVADWSESITGATFLRGDVYILFEHLVRMRDSVSANLEVINDNDENALGQCMANIAFITPLGSDHSNTAEVSEVSEVSNGPANLQQRVQLVRPLANPSHESALEIEIHAFCSRRVRISEIFKSLVISQKDEHGDNSVCKLRLIPRAWAQRFRDLFRYESQMRDHRNYFSHNFHHLSLQNSLQDIVVMQPAYEGMAPKLDDLIGFLITALDDPNKWMPPVTDEPLKSDSRGPWKRCSVIEMSVRQLCEVDRLSGEVGRLMEVRLTARIPVPDLFNTQIRVAYFRSLHFHFLRRARGVFRDMQSIILGLADQSLPPLWKMTAVSVWQRALSLFLLRTTPTRSDDVDNWPDAFDEWARLVW
jgi:hypothetical protein